MWPRLTRPLALGDTYKSLVQQSPISGLNCFRVVFAAVRLGQVFEEVDLTVVVLVEHGIVVETQLPSDLRASAIGVVMC
jgi:hypothetical protein